MENLVSLPALIVLSLATFRLTRFILFDSLISGSRERFHGWLVNKNGLIANKLWDLSTCSWCSGFWVALLGYSLYIWSNPTDFNQNDWISVFGVTGLAGLLHAYEPGDDE